MGYKGIDFAQHTDVPTAAQLEAFYEQEGVRFATIGVSDLNKTKRGPQMDVVSGSRLQVEVFPYIRWDRAEWQIEDMLKFLDPYSPVIVWADAEDVKSIGNRTPKDLLDILDRCLKMIEDAGYETGVYTAYWFWTKYMANSQKYKNRKLWYAQWNRGSGNIWRKDWAIDFTIFERFGGWEVAHTRQYIDSVIVQGLNVDLNYREVPLVQPAPPVQEGPMKYLYPVPSNLPITQRPGALSVTGIKHQGADFGGWNIYGTQVVAAQDGLVYQAVNGIADNWTGDWRKGDPSYGGYGNHIKIRHDDGSITLYAHLIPNSLLVSSGERVNAGDPIGLLGTSGLSTGPHLHFELRRPPNFEVFDFIAAGLLSTELEDEMAAQETAQKALNAANFNLGLNRVFAQMGIGVNAPNGHTDESRRIGREGLNEFINMWNLGPGPRLRIEEG